ncbi:MAG: FAD-dependent oxidoreductase [Pirellulales bacterium]
MSQFAEKFSRRRLLQGGAFGLAGLVAASTERIASAALRFADAHELSADVLVIGGSLGGTAAALAAARLGRRMILTEETEWLGGQATTQGVPLDEHPWIEDYGRTRTYAEFRSGVRDYYRRHYPLIPQAKGDKYLNPGAGWVSGLGFEPLVGLAVLQSMLAPHVAAGRIIVLARHRPTSVEMAGDRIRAVVVQDDRRDKPRVLTAPFVLDATELGELLELGDVERVVGAESQAETGEPLALQGKADPRDQMGFTHIVAMDHLPGEDHVLEKPRDYDAWREAINSHNGKRKLEVPDLFGAKHDHFGRPVVEGRYTAATWNFRRLLCRDNLTSNAVPSDFTVAIWSHNEYHSGVLCGVPADERRKHLEGARQLSLSLLYWLQTEAPDPATGRRGFPGLRPRGDLLGTDDGLAQYPYIRESTRIRAEFTVLEQHFRTDVKGQESGPLNYDDSVGLGGYRIDIHKPAKQGSASITEAVHGKHWCQQIPLGALLPVRVDNLLPACKNLGVTSVTNGAFRLHPVEWNIGEVAGSLAAYCLEHGLTPRQVRNTAERLSDFQRELVLQGVELKWPKMETARSYFSHHKQEVQDADDFYFGEAKRLRH